MSANAPCEFARLPIPRNGSLAVLAPHPDDFDAVCVTMRRFRQLGWRLHVAVLTTGASGVADDYPGATNAAAKAALREDEQRASCEAFGLSLEDLHFLRLAEDERGHPRDDDVNRRRIRAFLHDVRPRYAFMPHGNDTNLAHRRTWEMFRDIASEDGLRVEAWLNRDAKTRDMRESVLTRFGAAEAAWKASLLRLHHTQQARNLATRGHGFDERVLAVNRAAAERAGWPDVWAEAFEIVRFGGAA